MVEQNTMPTMPTMTSPGIKSLDESDLSSASEQLLANLNNFNNKPESSDEDPPSPENPDSGVSSRVENILDPKMLQKFFGNFPFRPSLQMNNPFFAAFQQQQLMNLNGVFGAGTSTPGSSRQTPERNEEDEDLENMNGTEPEDLSLGRLGKDKKGSDEDSGSLANSSYTFEEQFKQLYEVNDDPNRKAWLDDWFSFMNKIGKPVTRIPIMAKQVLDLYELYHLVIKHGGLVEIINKKLWREITKGLNLPASITSAAFTLRTQYQKYLYDYECDRMNLSTPSDLTAAIEANKREGRRNPGPMMGGNSLSGSLGTNLMMNGTPGPGHHGFPNWGMPFFGKFGSPFGFKSDDENPLATLTNNQQVLAAAAAASMEPQKQFELFQR
ncbi:hypothetical protein FO519_005995 [Halicephalobus sp. NKZ332]|nr:hypothetical protein FO519_005995 [Halicephalobus sp. NKZ332]